MDNFFVTALRECALVCNLHFIVKVLSFFSYHGPKVQITQDKIMELAGML
jgi:hypothetical protein